VLKALDGPTRVAEPHFDPTAASQSHGQVRINHQCSVKEGITIIEISDDKGERVSGETEHGRIILA